LGNIHAFSLHHLCLVSALSGEKNGVTIKGETNGGEI
jgi:hypothetical protein